jgi:hypothetical protein
MYWLFFFTNDDQFAQRGIFAKPAAHAALCGLEALVLA